MKITIPIPQQSMSDFFARADVKALQEIQKRNSPFSDAHKKATADLRALAVGIGAGEYFD